MKGTPFLKTPAAALFMQERHNNMAVSFKNEQLQIIYKSVECKIKLTEIEYIEADEWLCKICTADMNFTCAVRFGKLCGQLSEYGFLRCHKGYAVNIRQVKEAASTKIMLTSGKTIPVGRAYKNSVRDFFEKRCGYDN